jgi:4-aminobutyrate---pyruvate transaminase
MLHAPNSASARDIAFTLHPYTNARLLEQTGALVIERGKGIYVYDEDGTEYIEGMAGLWSVALGFDESRLVGAAHQQLLKLPFYHNFVQKTHSPLIDLAERLVGISPNRLSRVFFANSGSEANDTVVKLVWYYNNAIGRRQKKKIISRVRAYHGITVASGSLTGLPWNHQDFDLPILNVLHTTCPYHYRLAHEGESEEEFATRLASDLDALILREGPETVAAFIGEPVMGAGGVIVPPRTYWEKMQAVCRKHDVLVIADEVITGFGRTGKMFGCNTFNINPDIMVLSKQLTSSYLPLSAVLFTDDIYQKIADNTREIGTFGHGFTTGGHPVAAAVALESLKIFEERRIVDHAAAMALNFASALRRFSGHPLVGDVRSVGLVGAIELVAERKSKAPFLKPGSTGSFLSGRCQHYGLIVRSIGDTIAFCPPLIIEAGQIEEMFVRFGKALDDTYSWSKSQPQQKASI